MRRLAASILLALTACPIPQPLAEVARTTNGQTVSTVLVLPDTASPSDTVVYLRRDCPDGARIPLAVTVEDINTSETVEVRWFLNYGLPYGVDGARLLDDYNVPASTNTSDPQRPVPPLTFQPYAAGATASRTVDVVEAVVSNGFLPSSDPTAPVQRATASPYLAQSYRWVFEYVDASDARGRCL